MSKSYTVSRAGGTSMEASSMAEGLEKAIAVLRLMGCSDMRLNFLDEEDKLLVYANDGDPEKGYFLEVAKTEVAPKPKKEKRPVGRPAVDGWVKTPAVFQWEPPPKKFVIAPTDRLPAFFFRDAQENIVGVVDLTAHQRWARQQGVANGKMAPVYLKRVEEDAEKMKELGAVKAQYCLMRRSDPTKPYGPKTVEVFHSKDL